MTKVVPLMASADETWKVAAQRIEMLEEKNAQLIRSNRTLLADLDRFADANLWQRRVIYILLATLGAVVLL